MTPPTQTPIYKCPRLYKRVLPLFLAWWVFSLAVILPFGNPQWSRAVYLFQWKVWPGKLPNPYGRNLICTWTDWYANGRTAMVTYPKSGIRIDAAVRVWDRNGQEIYRSTVSGSGLKTLVWVEGQWREIEAEIGIDPDYSEAGVQFSLHAWSPGKLSHLFDEETWEVRWVTKMNASLKASP